MASKLDTPGAGKPLIVRVQPPLHKRLCDWIKRHPDGDLLTFPEAVRRLIELGLCMPGVKAGAPIGVTLDGKRFRSVRAAAEAHGLSVRSVYIRIHRTKETAAQAITAMVERRRSEELRKARALAYAAARENFDAQWEQPAREKREREPENVEAYDF